MTPREKLEAERDKIRARQKRRADQDRIDRQRLYAIEGKLWLLGLEPLIGVAGGVMMRYRGRNRRIPDHVTGTLTKIGRTRCDVDFGEHGSWSISGGNLIAASASDQRGFVLQLGAIR